MKISSIILLLFLFSCESGLFCDEDCNGVCGGSAVEDECGICNGLGIETPEFTFILFDAGDVCDCDGNIWDCSGVCGGNNENSEYIFCDGNCHSFQFNSTIDIGDVCDCDENVWDCSGVCGGNDNPVVITCNGYYDCDGTGLHDGWCSDYAYACEETNCDEGDCGEWDGSHCVGGAAIKYDIFYTSSGSLSYSIYSEDPSIPNSFYNNHYYESIPGTYFFEYIVYYNGEYEEYWYGYYTTYYPIDDHNKCFDLKISWLTGSYLYDWHLAFPWISDNHLKCANYFGYTCEDTGAFTCDNGDCVEELQDCNNRSGINKEDITLEFSDDKLEEYKKEVEKYKKYLSDKEKEQQILNERGINTQNSISNVTINKIDNPQNNHSIMEIDNHPDVVIQQGENYILKHIKKKVTDK